MDVADSGQKLNDVIEHYKRHIGRATAANNNDSLMKVLSKLFRLPITVQILQKTGIGRVVNSLRKYEGDIGESAKSLVIKWKKIVKIEETENFYQKEENSDDERQDVSSTIDDENLQINQNISSNVAASTSFYNNNNSYSNEPELSDEKNNDASDRESSHHRHHDKSKNKKSKRDKDSKKRKDSTSSIENQKNGHVSKKLKKDHKHETETNRKEIEKYEVPTTSHHKNHHSSEENNKKDKKSSHSDKKKDRHKSESKSHKDKHESKTSHKDKSDSNKKAKDKNKEQYKPSTSANPGANSSSKTFEDALLGIEFGKNKKLKSKCKDRSNRSSSLERESSPVSLSMKLAPLNLDPEDLISNYKPLPQLDVRKKKIIDDSDPLASIMTTKNLRTKVFSGNKTTIYTEVPTLIDFCVQIIKDNLDALEYTGGVPFEILEPILKHANPDQLYNLEQYNDYLIEDTGELWKFHCTKEFRNKTPGKKETWRDFYMRCLEERETKLIRLRHNINANQAASTPVRKTQLAYVDTAVKPPRGIARKQAKFNTATESKRNILNKSLMGGNSTAEALSANKKSTVMATNVPVALTSAHHSHSSAALKKKKAPLMQKALQLIKSSRRR